jgi:precorrin-6B methylase 2
MILLWFYGISLFLFALGVLWVMVPAFFGPPSRPTRPERIRHALKLVNLQPGETLYDLGAGDGRVLLIAAREFGAKAVGIEVGPIQCALIWLRIVAGGFGDKIRLKWGNYFHADLSQADVVYIYATSREIMRLASHLQRQMKSGSRVVSISADFPEWEPAEFNEEDLIFVYHMPPTYGSLTTYLLKKSA